MKAAEVDVDVYHEPISFLRGVAVPGIPGGGVTVS
jgi:hypothetical protein